MKAKKLFPDLSIKRLWDKIKDLESKVGEGNTTIDTSTIRYNSGTDMIEIYYNGQWQEWISSGLQEFLLYNYGTFFQIFNLAGTYTENTDNITLSALESVAQNMGVMATKNTIDITKYNKLIIEGDFDILEDGSSNIRIGFINSNEYSSSDNASEFVGNYIEFVNDNTTKSKFILDVSNMIGDFYLRISGYRALLLINKIYLS